MSAVLYYRSWSCSQILGAQPKEHLEPLVSCEDDFDYLAYDSDKNSSN